jgi:hypothetical protein
MPVFAVLAGGKVPLYGPLEKISESTFFCSRKTRETTKKIYAESISKV